MCVCVAYCVSAFPSAPVCSQGPDGGHVGILPGSLETNWAMTGRYQPPSTGEPHQKAIQFHALNSLKRQAIRAAA